MGQIDFIIQNSEKKFFLHFSYKGGGGPQLVYRENTFCGPALRLGHSDLRCGHGSRGRWGCWVSEIYVQCAKPAWLSIKQKLINKFVIQGGGGLVHNSLSRKINDVIQNLQHHQTKNKNMHLIIGIYFALLWTLGMIAFKIIIICRIMEIEGVCQIKHPPPPLESQIY